MITRVLNAARCASGGQLENREIVVVVNVGRLAAATGRLAGEMFKLRQTWNNVSIRISAAAVQPSETDKTLSCQDPNFKPKEHKEFWLHDHITRSIQHFNPLRSRGSATK